MVNMKESRLASIHNSLKVTASSEQQGKGSSIKSATVNSYKLVVNRKCLYFNFFFQQLPFPMFLGQQCSFLEGELSIKGGQCV